MTFRCDSGFVCEDHPDQPDGHEGAAPACAGMRPNGGGGRIVELPERAGPMLKADAPLRWRRVGES